MASDDLNSVFEQAKLNKSLVAKALNVSRSALVNLLTNGVTPKKWSSTHSELLVGLLVAGGVSIAQARRSLNTQAADKTSQKKPLASTEAASGGLKKASDITDQSINTFNRKELFSMLPKKCSVGFGTRAHFKLAADPLPLDLNSREDVFLAQELRFVLDTMGTVARSGGALAVVGESGCGKTTLKQAMIEKLRGADSKTIVVEPYVQAMEDNDAKGKTLKSLAIAHSIITALDPLARPRRDAQGRFEQLHRLLINNAKSGNHVVLVIEEAHCLPIPTLKHLKRFLELRDGFKCLISIVLIGQPELGLRLNPKNAETREVTQRFDVMTVPPLTKHVQAFIEHKFKRAGSNASAVFAKDAYDALVSRLAPTGRGNNLYPLAIANMAAAAMNEAAMIGAPLVSAEIMQGVSV